MNGPQPWAEGICVQGGVATIQGILCLVANVFSITITMIGLIGFLMLVVGAFRYLLSGGSSKGTENAKNTIVYAVVGLLVALSSFFILNLIAEFTGVKTILDFVIPSPSHTP